MILPIVGALECLKTSNDEVFFLFFLSLFLRERKEKTKRFRRVSFFEHEEIFLHRVHAARGSIRLEILLALS